MWCRIWPEKKNKSALRSRFTVWQRSSRPPRGTAAGTKGQPRLLFFVTSSDSWGDGCGHAVIRGGSDGDTPAESLSMPHVWQPQWVHAEHWRSRCKITDGSHFSRRYISSAFGAQVTCCSGEHLPWVFFGTRDPLDETRAQTKKKRILPQQVLKHLWVLQLVWLRGGLLDFIA